MFWVNVIIIVSSCIAAAFFGAYLATLSPDYGKPIMSIITSQNQEPTLPTETKNNIITSSPSNEKSNNAPVAPPAPSKKTTSSGSVTHPTFGSSNATHR